MEEGKGKERGGCVRINRICDGKTYQMGATRDVGAFDLLAVGVEIGRPDTLHRRDVREDKQNCLSILPLIFPTTTASPTLPHMTSAIRSSRSSHPYALPYKHYAPSPQNPSCHVCVSLSPSSSYLSALSMQQSSPMTKFLP